MEFLNTLIVGGGPAGLGVLVWAARQGFLPELAASGLAIVEKTERLGAGALGDYDINSDTLAETFLECAEQAADPRLHALAAHPAALAIAAHRGAGVGLPLAARFLGALGETVGGMVREAGGRLLTGHRALDTQRLDGGVWRTRLRREADGTEVAVLSRFVVLATGGLQSADRLAREPVAGEPLLPRYADKLVLSQEALTGAGRARLAARLAGVAHPRVAIVGGSHSALASAHALLHRLPDVRFAPGAISLLHRRKLPIFYPSAAAAAAEGYGDFTEADICPLTGRVYRLAGFRLEARELAMRALGVGGRPPEPRLRLHRLAGGDDPVSRALLDAADLIVAALGYRPRALPVLDRGGARLPLLAEGPGAPPLVDGTCRVLDAAGRPLPGLFGIGLAAGFVPGGPLGGEPSFSGQTNGLWLWQNGIGAIIADALRARAHDAVA